MFGTVRIWNVGVVIASGNKSVFCCFLDSSQGLLGPIILFGIILTWWGEVVEEKFFFKKKIFIIALK